MDKNLSNKPSVVTTGRKTSRAQSKSNILTSAVSKPISAR